MSTMKNLLLRLLAIPFFAAAAGIYIYVHFFSPEPVDCNAFSFFSTFDFGCLITSLTWGVVCVVAFPGVLLWMSGASRKETEREYAQQLTTNEWSMEHVEKIINDYGAALMNKVPGPNSMVADESQLPHSKVVVKKAILYFLENGNPTEEQKDALVSGFISMADFQPSVDDEDHGVDVASESFAALPTEKQIVAVSEGGLGEEWLQKSAVERDELIAELTQAGYWKG